MRILAPSWRPGPLFRPGLASARTRRVRSGKRKAYIASSKFWRIVDSIPSYSIGVLFAGSPQTHDIASYSTVAWLCNSAGRGRIPAGPNAAGYHRFSCILTIAGPCSQLPFSNTLPQVCFTSSKSCLNSCRATVAAEINNPNRPLI